MFRVLVIEDQTEFYQNYLLRIFSTVLPMDRIQFTHVVNIAGGLENLGEAWDVILMDFALGAAYTVNETNSVFRDGSDLVRLRRRLEADINKGGEGDVLPPSFIIGISSHQVGNRAIVDAGADASLLKIHVTEMAKEIGRRIDLNG